MEIKSTRNYTYKLINDKKKNVLSHEFPFIKAFGNGDNKVFLAIDNGNKEIVLIKDSGDVIFETSIITPNIDFSFDYFNTGTIVITDIAKSMPNVIAVYNYMTDKLYVPSKDKEIRYAQIFSYFKNKPTIDCNALLIINKNNTIEIWNALHNHKVATLSNDYVHVSFAYMFNKKTYIVAKHKDSTYHIISNNEVLLKGSNISYNNHSLFVCDVHETIKYDRYTLNLQGIYKYSDVIHVVNYLQGIILRYKDNTYNFYSYELGRMVFNENIKKEIISAFKNCVVIKESEKNTKKNISIFNYKKNKEVFVGKMYNWINYTDYLLIKPTTSAYQLINDNGKVLCESHYKCYNMNGDCFVCYDKKRHLNIYSTKKKKYLMPKHSSRIYYNNDNHTFRINYYTIASAFNKD